MVVLMSSVHVFVPNPEAESRYHLPNDTFVSLRLTKTVCACLSRLYKHQPRLRSKRVVLHRQWNLWLQNE